MFIEWIKPTGSLIQGHVNDSRVSDVLRAIQSYDKQLYIKWNAKKNKGHGIWEIRRKPERLTCTHVGGGFNILSFKEIDIVHHVMDVPVLRRDLVLKELIRMDAWANSQHGKNFIEQSESAEKSAQSRIAERNASERSYNIKHNKKLWKDAIELVRSGVTPSELLLGKRLK